MTKPLEPGCLAYVAHTSTNVSARGRIVIAVQPWAAGDVFEVDDMRFSNPRNNDIWWIKPVREGETLPVCCSYAGDPIYEGEALVSIDRAAHLRRIDGPAEDTAITADCEVAA